MLPRATGLAKPGIVRDVQDPRRAAAGQGRPLSRKARKQALVTDQGLDQRQAIKLDRLRPWTRREIIWGMDQTPNAQLPQDLAKGQIFPEGHQPVLVIEASHSQALTLAADTQQAVIIDRSLEGASQSIAAHHQDLTGLERGHDRITRPAAGRQIVIQGGRNSALGPDHHRRNGTLARQGGQGGIFGQNVAEIFRRPFG